MLAVTFIAKVQRTLLNQAPQFWFGVPCKSNQSKRRAIKESAWVRFTWIYMMKTMAAAMALVSCCWSVGSIGDWIGGGTTENRYHFSLNGIVTSNRFVLVVTVLMKPLRPYVRRQYGKFWLVMLPRERIKTEIVMAYHTGEELQSRCSWS